MAERTKNTSRIGPETPAVRLSTVQMAPHTVEWNRRSTFRCRLSGNARATKGVSPRTISATGLLTTSCTAVKTARAASEP